jgi:peptidoglycan/xylan/chitin deacetylase (PgdA/CDA1 family)
MILFSCQKKKTEPYTAGVVISFDDAYVDEWFETDKVLKKYDWKATFCVCKIDSIGRSQINKLLQLQKEGHEIAGHGYHHYNAVTYVQKHGIDSYVKQEIEPMIQSMRKHSFKVTSFAYPYGERSDLLDKTLSSKFQIIRGRAFCGVIPEKEGCYFNRSKYVYAFDIDNSHVHFSIPYLVELLDYAKRNNKILILCSHKPVTEVTENYQTKVETLEFICNYVKQNHLKFYTLSDLNHLE